MRKLAFFAPLAVTLAVAAAAQAQPAGVSVVIGPDLQRKADEIGYRDVTEQADRLADRVRDAAARDARFEGARFDLVLTDLKPNRPTMEQTNARPGLSYAHSFGIGGAAIEGEVLTADGQRLPVRFSYYSDDIRWARYAGTWEDADRAFERFAANVSRGRLVSR
jgi:hypothetical protein